MLKYGVWTDPFARNVIKISDAFNATQRPGKDKKQLKTNFVINNFLI